MALLRELVLLTLCVRTEGVYDATSSKNPSLTSRTVVQVSVPHQCSTGSHQQLLGCSARYQRDFQEQPFAVEG
jgi:hypothetical protein